jgi:uncharacterized membrane protein YfhO
LSSLSFIFPGWNIVHTFHIVILYHFLFSLILAWVVIISICLIVNSFVFFFSGQTCFLWEGGHQPNSQPPTWRTTMSLVWNLTLDLSGLRDPSGRYATTGIALEITGSHKLHCHKLEIPSGRQMNL